MYAPLHQLTVAWAVYANKNEDAPSCSVIDFQRNCFKCTHTGLTFNKISVNLGNVWSSTTNEAIIPVKGLYYVTFVLFSAECHLEASLFVNKSATASIVKTASDNIGYLITRERAVLLSLAEKDIVSVKIINGTVATVRDLFIHSFSGILIYPL